jgi:threonine 3-dehydrogenase
MMKCLIKNKPTQSYEYTEIEVPEPKEGELLVEMERVAICGSDIPLYKWDATGQRIAQLPFIPGHECVGKVVKLGPGVTNVNVGDRVCSETHIPCEKCYQCTHNQMHICQNMGLFGHGKKTIYGGFAQYTIMYSNAIHKLKSDLSPDVAVLLEPFGVAQHAVEEVELNGESIVITGCGPIGLFCIAIAKALGSEKVIATDVLDIRLEKAKELGAGVVINCNGKDIEWVQQQVLAATNGIGAGCCIECSGASSNCNGMFKLIRKGGRLVLVGLPKTPLHVEDVIVDLHWKNFTLRSIHGRKMFRTWEESEKLLASGKVKIESTISHVFPMSQFEKAFEVLFSGNANKIIINPQL